MPLIIGGGGDSKPFIRFKLQVNAWEMSSEAGMIEFEWNSPVVFDIENIQLGWLLLGEGLREWQPWPNNNQTAKPHEGEWKTGFEVNVFSKALFGDEPVRQFSSSQTGALEFIKKLYNECESNFGSGQVPVIEITGAKATRIGRGTTRIPEFVIKKWIDRPAELASQNHSPSAPQPAEAPAPAAAEVDEF
jgi:hypothetical protein